MVSVFLRDLSFHVKTSCSLSVHSQLSLIFLQSLLPLLLRSVQSNLPCHPYTSSCTAPSSCSLNFFLLDRNFQCILVSYNMPESYELANLDQSFMVDGHSFPINSFSYKLISFSLHWCVISTYLTPLTLSYRTIFKSQFWRSWKNTLTTRNLFLK